MIPAIINLIFPGSGLFWYHQGWQGIGYLVAFGLLNIFRVDIGAMWAIYIVVMAQVHFYRVRKNDYQTFDRTGQILIWFITALVIGLYLLMYGPDWTNDSAIKYPLILFLLVAMALTLPALNLTVWLKGKKLPKEIRSTPTETGQ